MRTEFNWRATAACTRHGAATYRIPEHHRGVPPDTVQRGNQLLTKPCEQCVRSPPQAVANSPFIVHSPLRPFESILGAASFAELTPAIQGAADALGFSSFHYGAHAPVKQDGQQARFTFDGIEQQHGGVISTYPDAWVSHYQAQRYIEVDPLVRHCARSIVPAAWHAQPPTADIRVAQLFGEAAGHGLAAGATFSIIGKQGEWAIFSLTCERRGAAERRNVEAQLGPGYLLLACLHESVARLGLPASAAAHPATLTRRERECLRWVSIGKTSWEISRILGVAESTAIFHIGNAGRKLQTSTRAQTVARAIALGLIAP